MKLLLRSVPFPCPSLPLPSSLPLKAKREGVKGGCREEGGEGRLRGGDRRKHRRAGEERSLGMENEL